MGENQHRDRSGGRVTTCAAAYGTGGGERVRGAARGAAAGAVVGGIAGDAGTGAGAGAAAGVVAGGARARQNQRAQNAQAQQQQQDTLATYYKAYGACMEGRGYTVK